MTNTGTAQAQGESGAAPTLAELFPIPEEARALARFLGTWSASGTLTVGANAMPMHGEWRFTSAAAGWGVASSLEAQIEGMGTYREDDLVGYDTETGTVHIYSLTNTAAVHDHPARWTTDDTLEFEYHGTQDGKPYREVGRVQFVAPDRMRVESSDYVDGDLASAMEMTLERQ